MKKNFLMYLEYEEYFDMLSAREQAKLIKAMFTYQKKLSTRKLELDMDKHTKMCWAFIKNQLAKDTEKYEEKCERNRTNGRLGGRPKNQTVSEKTERFSEKPKKTERLSEKPKKSEWFFEKPKKPDNDNDNERDNDYDSERDNDSKISLSQKKFAEAYPHRDATLPALQTFEYDIDKLLVKISESTFLNSCDNLGLAWLIEHYDEILQDKYRDFSKQQSNNDESIHKRNYTESEVNSIFDNFNDLEV